MSIASDLHIVAVEAQKRSELLHGIQLALLSIDNELTRIADALNPKPTDLKLNFKENTMASKEPLVVKMKATKGGMKAVGDPVHWSKAAGGIILQVIDDAGNDLPNPAVTDVTSTLGSDNNTLMSIAKVDELDYNIHKEQTPTNPPPTVTVTAALNYNAGTPGPFSATLPIIMDVPAPADLKLKFTQA